jgi:hypothetical protein
MRCSPSERKVQVFSILTIISMASFLALVSMYSVYMVWLNSLISCGEAFKDCSNGNDDGLENTVASLCENCQEWSVPTKSRDCTRTLYLGAR